MSRPLPPALALALDGAQVAPLLGGLVQDVFGPRARVRGVTGQILKRRTVRYTVELDGAPTASWRLVGKVYESRAAGEAGWAAQRWLREQGFAALPPGNVLVPRILAFLPELGLLLMEEAGGRSLQRLLKAGKARAEGLLGFADVLTKLHRFPLTYGRPFTLERHLEQRCRGQAGLLARVFPDLAPSIDRIVALARHTESEELRARFTLAHGDYHPGQVHVDGERLWLIDLDLLHDGDPAYDVAMAVVKLKGLGARLGRDFRAEVERFLARYFSGMERAGFVNEPTRRAESARPTDPSSLSTMTRRSTSASAHGLSIAERVPLAAALVFLKRACKRFFWRDEPAWPDAVREQLALAEECMDLRARTPPARDLAGAIELCAGLPPAH